MNDLSDEKNGGSLGQRSGCLSSRRVGRRGMTITNSANNILMPEYKARQQTLSCGGTQAIAIHVKVTVSSNFSRNMSDDIAEPESDSLTTLDDDGKG